MPFNIGDIINGIFGGDNTNTEERGARTEQQTGTIRDDNQSTTDNKQSTQTGSVTATNQTSTTSNNQTSRLLTDEQIAAGNIMLQRLSGRGETDLSMLEGRIRGSNDSSLKAARDLLARAEGADAVLAGNTEAIIANARNEAGKTRDRQYQSVVSAGGSAFSSASQDIFARATTDEELQLAALAAEMATKNRQLATQELVAAVGALSTVGGQLAQTELAVPLAGAQIRGLDANSATNLLSSLKGGVSSTAGSSTSVVNGRQETQQTVNTTGQSVVDSINNRTLNLNQNIVTAGNTSVENDRDLIDLITAAGR
jgi:hypothetical protein